MLFDWNGEFKVKSFLSLSHMSLHLLSIVFGVETQSKKDKMKGKPFSGNW